DTASVCQPSRSGRSGTRPGDGRSPTTLQNDAGLRNDPPMSLPSQVAAIPVARAAAAPPDEPPATRPGSYGLRVAPKSGLTLWLPVANSGTFVLPRVITPARRIRSTTIASAVGTFPASS